MRATARILWGLLAVTLGSSAAWTSASPIGLPLDTHLATLVVSQTSPSAPSTSVDNRRQSDDLLRRAQQAIDEGHFDVAEKLIQRAEAFGVFYNPLDPLANTPTRVRRQLQRKRRTPSSPNSLTRLVPPLPLGGKTPAGRVLPDPFNQINSGQASPGAIGYAIAQSTPPPQARVNSPNRSQAGGLLLEARRALAMGDVRRATDLAGQAKSHRLTYGPNDDTPDAVLADVHKYRDLVSAQQTRKHTEAYRRQLARLMMQQAEALLRWKDYHEAERLTTLAKDQRVAFGPLETNPDALLQRIAVARRQQRPPLEGVAPPAPQAMAAKIKVTRLVRRARAALSGGDLASAETFARAAMSLQVPESSFAPDEDRPGLVLLDIQKARRAGSRTVPADGQLPPGRRASHAVYDPSNDPTKNVPAGAQQRVPKEIPRPLAPGQLPPAPVPPKAGQARPSASVGGASAVVLFRQGEAAWKARDVKKALEFYRQAARYRDQLDPVTAQQLQDRLQMLSSPAPPEAPKGGMADEALARQQLLARQVNSDIAHQVHRAAQLRESNPRAGLALLEQARMRVEAAGLEPNVKGILLRRLDRSLAEMRQFIEDNRARIDLAQRNDQTRQQVDREQQHELEMQQRIAMLGEKFNQLRDEQRYFEAEVIAKEAYDLAPNNPFARQLLLDAKFARRVARNRQIAAEKEAGVLDALASVDEASRPFDDRNPMVFPPATEWSALSASRSRFKSDTRKDRTGREYEIQQKLKTPVSVQFTDVPLGEVLARLQQLADVNMHLDPQGLQEEGIASSTPVTINLRHEISLASALNHILEPLHLSYVIKDEVLKITSEHYRDGEVYTVTYDVGDLVVPIPNFVPNSRMGLGGAYNDAMGRNGFNNATFGGGVPPLNVLGSADAPKGAAINAAVLAQMSQPMPGSAAGPGAGASMPTGFGPGGLGGGTQADFDPLIRLITSTIAPDSWQDMGGEGTIEEYENNLTLVIKQTEEVHAEIVDVLEQLRRLQDLQVTIEVRFITLNDDFFESIRVDFDFDIDDDIDRPFQVFGREIEGGDDDDDDDTALEPARDTSDVDHDRSVTVGLNAPGVFSADLDIPFVQGSYELTQPQFGGFDPTAGASLGFAVLSDIEAFFFINAAQGDSRTNILQAPKVTLFNGQQAFVSDISQSPFVMGLIPVVGDFAAAQQPVIVILSEGTFLTVQAVVSHDRRFVRLTVIPFFSQIGDVNTFTFTGRTTSTVDTSTEGNQEAPDDATKTNNIISTTSEGTTVQLPTYSTISVSTTVSVPDGGTVLLGGIKRLSEGRSEFGTPILNKIPYINRLFRNVGIGRETQSLMMTVTPRIIIQEEEEERVTAGPAGS